MDSSTIYIVAVLVCAFCTWALGVIFGIAYTVEKAKSFKRPPLAVVEDEKEETA